MWFKGNGRVLLNQSGFAAIIYKRRAIAVNGWLEEGGGRRLVAVADSMKPAVPPDLPTARYR